LAQHSLINAKSKSCHKPTSIHLLILTNPPSSSTCNGGVWDCGDTADCEFTVKCPNNQDYFENYHVCGRTCASYNDRAECSASDPTRDQCGCGDGTVMDHEVSDGKKGR
jgi:hypothetical protein